jgi:nicotinate-nucleotide adenylyltransferase
LLAEDVRERLALDRVVFMPAGVPPHKPAIGIAPAADRHAMVRLAIADNPAFEVSDLELKRVGPSYTVDTVDALGVPPADLFLLIGSETFLDLLSWREPRRLASRCRLVVIPRSGSPFDPDSEAARKVLREIGLDGIEEASAGVVPARGVIVARATSLPISASVLRARAEAGRSMRYRVPAPVAEYIARNGLYRGHA